MSGRRGMFDNLNKRIWMNEWSWARWSRGLCVVQCFQCPNYFRVVLTVPEDKLREASRRIAEFCSRHYTAPLSNGHIWPHAAPRLCCHYLKPCRTASILHIGRVAYIGSRPSDHYFRGVCLSVCLSVCLFVLFVCAEFFSAAFDPILIKLGHMLHVRV